jgi:hypothetical protein
MPYLQNGIPVDMVLNPLGYLLFFKCFPPHVNGMNLLFPRAFMYPGISMVTGFGLYVFSFLSPFT